MTARLKLIDQGATKPPRDIYAAWKADIAAVNWSATHIAGDRRAPVELADTRKGWSR